MACGRAASATIWPRELTLPAASEDDASSGAHSPEVGEAASTWVHLWSPPKVDASRSRAAVQPLCSLEARAAAAEEAQAKTTTTATSGGIPIGLQHLAIRRHKRASRRTTSAGEHSIAHRSQHRQAPRNPDTQLVSGRLSLSCRENWRTGLGLLPVAAPVDVGGGMRRPPTAAERGLRGAGGRAGCLAWVNIPAACPAGSAPAGLPNLSPPTPREERDGTQLFHSWSPPPEFCRACGRRLQATPPVTYRARGLSFAKS